MRKRERSVHLLMTESEYADMKRLAEAQGLTVSEWVRLTALASRIVVKQPSVLLGRRVPVDVVADDQGAEAKGSRAWGRRRAGAS